MEIRRHLFDQNDLIRGQEQPSTPCSGLDFLYNGDGSGNISVLDAKDNGIAEASTCKLMSK